MISKGRVRVRYGYSRYGWTRNNGKTFHAGTDEELLDDPTILFPYYNNEKSISGTVVSSRIVPEGSSDLTWEWGHYVCVQLDANQTPDAVNFIYFCHNEKNLVSVGQKVKSGDPIAIMGNTGNAKYANPPFKHCHLEVRATRTGSALDPSAYSGHANVVGTYGKAPEDPEGDFSPVTPGRECTVQVTAENGQAISYNDVNYYLKNWVQSEAKLDPNQCLKQLEDGSVLIGPISSGDQIQLKKYCAKNKLGFEFSEYIPTPEEPEEPEEPTEDAEALKAEIQALRNMLASVTAERDAALAENETLTNEKQELTERAERAEKNAGVYLEKIEAAKKALGG